MDEKRKYPRTEIEEPAFVSSGGSVMSCVVRNISSGGALIECREEMPTGAVIQLDFAAGGLVEAEIRWSKGTQFGVQFKDKFNLKLLQPTKAIAKPTTVLTPSYLSGATSTSQAG